MLPVGDPFAVAAIAHSLGGGLVPDVAAGRPGDFVERPLRRIRDAAVAAIAQGPDPLDEIGGISPHRPFMAVGADLALDVKVVQEHELAGQGVVVGRDGLGEQADVRIAVAFFHVAEDLVVGAVFLDDVDDVLDRRRLADLGGDRVSGGGARSGHGRRIASPQRAALVNRLGIGGHLPGGRHRDGRERPLEEPADVFLGRDAATGESRSGPVAIGA